MHLNKHKYMQWILNMSMHQHALNNKTFSWYQLNKTNTFSKQALDINCKTKLIIPNKALDIKNKQVLLNNALDINWT